MSRAIVLRSIGGEEDKRFVLGNAQKARVLDLTPAFAAPTDWTRIRIGVRESLTDAGVDLAGTPQCWIGMLSNPSEDVANGPLGNATSHFVGMVPIGTSVGRIAGPPVRYLFGGLRTVKKVGSTVTTVTNPNLNKSIFIDTDKRVVSLIEITKGSPNFSVSSVICANSAAGDISKNAFLDAMGNATMGGAHDILEAASGGLHYSVGSTGSIAVDEGANGGLNAVCVAWNNLSSLYHYSDTYYAVFA